MSAYTETPLKWRVTSIVNAPTIRTLAGEEDKDIEGFSSAHPNPDMRCLATIWEILMNAEARTQSKGRMNIRRYLGIRFRTRGYSA